MRRLFLCQPKLYGQERAAMKFARSPAAAAGQASSSLSRSRSPAWNPQSSTSPPETCIKIITHIWFKQHQHSCTSIFCSWNFCSSQVSVPPCCFTHINIITCICFKQHFDLMYPSPPPENCPSMQQHCIVSDYRTTALTLLNYSSLFCSWYFCSKQVLVPLAVSQQPTKDGLSYPLDTWTPTVSAYSCVFP